jgi:ParB-like chromosome segregation protein Spo0J
MKYTQHPLSAAFPAMQADEFQSLVDSIGSIGVQNPITLLDGMVIDGWHRYKAATSLGMDCPTVELDDTDPRDFVLAQNKARRNLSASQRADAVTAVYAWRKEGRQNNSAVTAELTKTTKELAAIAGVGTRTIEQAKTVHSSGVKAVQEAVKTGSVSVEVAAAVAKLPAKEQQKVAAKGPEAMRQAAKPQEPANAPQIIPPPLAVVEQYTELDAAKDQIEGLQDALVVANIGSADPEEAAQAKNLIAELRAHIKTLEATLKAVKISRDGFQNQVAEMQKQINRQRREIDKLAGTKTA